MKTSLTARTRHLACIVPILVAASLGFALLAGEESKAAAPRVTAAVDRTQVLPGQPLTLEIKVEGAGGAEVAPFTIPNGLTVQDRGASTNYQWINGKTYHAVAHLYTVVPMAEGQYRLGPFKVRVGGKEYTAAAVDFAAVGGSTNAAKAQPPGEGTGDGSDTADLGLGDRVFLELKVDTARAYVGQRIPIVLRLYCAEVRLDEIQMPQIQTANLLVEPLPQPERKTVLQNGMRYEVMEFATSATPLVPGKVAIGPAELTCQVLAPRRAADPFADDDSFFSGFFGRFERYPLTLTAKAVPLTVAPLPENGRPADYSGGIGEFALAASASTDRVKLGDPVTLTFEVTGTGNLAQMKPRFLEEAAGFKVYPAQRRAKESTGENTVLFEQVVIPLEPSLTAIPPARLVYFDPGAGRYVIKQAGPFPLAITGGDQASLRANRPELFFRTDSAPEGTGVLGYDLVYIHERLGRIVPVGYRVYGQWWYWAVPALLCLALIVNWRVLVSRTRFYANSPEARWARAKKEAQRELAAAQNELGQGRAASAIEVIFRAVQSYFGLGLGRPSGGITAAVAAALPACGGGIDADYHLRLHEFFQVYDGYRYAGQGEQNAIAARMLALAKLIVEPPAGGKAAEEIAAARGGRV